tara:strand:- start:131 stop:604 length:474 start_codon:yes stop_codon:yes gene_type:complete
MLQKRGMTEIENFLNNNICKYLIDFFKSYKGELKRYLDRNIIQLQEIQTDDKIILDTIDLYKTIRPTQKLKNIELICWPGKGSHTWHKDILYYDLTTITYLNDNYVGGRTWVDKYEVQPKPGKLILFDSSMDHMVTELKQNDRFVLVAWYTNLNREQ